MRLLVTAGNTQAPIDSVRCITNIFTGRTGARLALYARQLGFEVVLLTSHPETVAELCPQGVDLSRNWRVERYRTFDELRARMETNIRAGSLDTIIHCAAVSDYLTGGVYAAADGTTFTPATGHWTSRADETPTLVDLTGGREQVKVKSDEAEVWLRLTRAPKLVDLIRGQWGWSGVLVKFKLEVGKTDADLQEIAERSRKQSGADLMVANTLEEADRFAFLGPVRGGYEKLDRSDLPRRLFEEIQTCSARGSSHG